MKRLFDFFVSLFLCFLLFPVWLVVFFIIMINDSGPIFYRQKRVGSNGEEFDILKFRTMYVNKKSSAATTLKSDPRVFNGGHFLRKYKIDELPQIFNVLNGTMSLVGPRPTVKEDVEKMSRVQKRRLAVRPGCTGLAQISGNTSISWGERIKLDLYYIDNWSFWFDLKILVKTFLLVLTGRADTHPTGDDEWEQK